MTNVDRLGAGLRPNYPIRTPRLLLRPHRASDVDQLFQFHSDPEVARFVPWPVRDRATTEEALGVKLNQDALSEPGQWLVLAVELGETSTVIGEVLLKWTSAEDRQGELGFAFARQHHGRGLAAEAAGAIIRLGFGELRLHRITAVCIEGNEASTRLLRRLGFALEARFVDNVIFKGQWATQLVYALTVDRWRDESAARGAAANADVDAVVDLVSRFFVAFTSGKGVDQRLDALRTVMLPEAIVVRTCGQPMAVYDVDSFIAPRRALLTDGSLTNFHEHAAHGRVDVYGDIAHWFGSSPGAWCMR